MNTNVGSFCNLAIEIQSDPSSSTPAEYSVGLELAISPRGWLELHESGTFVKLTQSGADLFA
jgi:hypothetical protein